VTAARSKPFLVGIAALGVIGCGGSAKHEAIPDVRGLNAPDAVARLVEARYCVQLRVGKPVSAQAGMPVQQEEPAAGAAGRAWSTVTLTIGVPTQRGESKHGKVTIGVDTWGGGKTPCRPIRATG
jgi:hypothetical protein